MKRSMAFFVVMVLVLMPVTKVSAYWIDKLNVDFSTMFIYPTQITVEKGGEADGAGDVFGQKQFNQQIPTVGGDDLLNFDKDTAPVQKLQTQSVGGGQLDVKHGERKHDMVPDVF